MLIAPDVAVTAARCLAGQDAGWFAVGFGAVGSKSYAIDDAIIQEDVDPDHALAALQLSSPVVGIDPAELVIDPVEPIVDPAEPAGDAPRRSCEVMTAAYLHVLRGETSSRWIWAGCVEQDVVRSTDGAPNCHGDMGSGAFAANGGRLLGIAIDIGTDGTCAVEQRFASVTKNAAFFEQALELSRPPA